MFYLDSGLENLGGGGRGDTYLVEVVISTAIRTVEPAKTTIRVLVHTTEGRDRDLMAAVEARQFPAEERRHDQSLCSVSFGVDEKVAGRCLGCRRRRRRVDCFFIFILFFCRVARRKKKKQGNGRVRLKKGMFANQPEAPAAAPFGGIFWTAERMNYYYHQQQQHQTFSPFSPSLSLPPSPSSSPAGPRSASAGPTIPSPSDHSPPPQRDGHAKCAHPLSHWPVDGPALARQPDRKAAAARDQILKGRAEPQWLAGC